MTNPPEGVSDGAKMWWLSGQLMSSGEGLLMKNKVLALASASVLALALSATASHAGYMQAGETMGVSLDSPLPEGVFFADLEDYGGQSGTPVKVGVNIPVLLWSTPWTFNNTRLEFLAAVPFAHIDGGGLNQVGAITYALGPILAHDFGNGLTGGISAFVRTPDPSANIAAISGRRAVEGDFRQSMQYTFATGTALGGVTFIENASVTTGFGQSAAIEGQNDQFAGDFAIEKTFDKFTIGFTGFGNYDINTNFLPRGRNVELGGLVGYDFGKVSLTAIVTHGVLAGGFTPGVTAAPGHETRGWLRLVVPLYVAPTAAPVVARY